MIEGGTISFFMSDFIIAMPMPPIFILDNFTLSSPFGNMVPHILPMKSLPLMRFFLSRRTGVPQNVKNMTTSMHIAEASVAFSDLR